MEWHADACSNQSWKSCPGRAKWANGITFVWSTRSPPVPSHCDMSNQWCCLWMMFGSWYADTRFLPNWILEGAICGNIIIILIVFIYNYSKPTYANLLPIVAWSVSHLNQGAFVGCGWTDCAKGTPMVSGVSRRRSRANSSPTHEVAWKSAGDGVRLRMPRENHGAYIWNGWSVAGLSCFVSYEFLWFIVFFIGLSLSSKMSIATM